MLGFQHSAGAWNRWLWTENGEGIAEALTYFHQNQPRLEPPHQEELAKLAAVLPQLTQGNTAISCLSAKKLRTGLQQLEQATSNFFWTEWEQHLSALLELQLGPLVWAELTVDALYGELYPARAGERWENIRGGIHSSLAESDWWTFRRCLPSEAGWSLILRRRAQRTLAAALGHYLLVVATQGDPLALRNDMDLATRAELAGTFLDLFRVGNYPVGLSREGGAGAQTCVVLVA